MIIALLVAAYIMLDGVTSMRNSHDTKMINQLVTESQEIQKNIGQLVVQNQKLLEQMTPAGLQKPQIGLQRYWPINPNNQRLVRLVKMSLRACKR